MLVDDLDLGVSTALPKSLGVVSLDNIVITPHITFLLS